MSTGQPGDFLAHSQAESGPQRSTKPSLVVVFDGALHENDTPWAGPDVVPDDAIPGSRRFLSQCVTIFEVHVWSARRSPSAEGRKAMSRWCERHYGEIHLGLRFPEHHPPALATYGHRCICFRGTFPEPLSLLNFTPWKPGR